MTALRVIVLALVCAVLTWFAGWWAVLVVALGIGACWGHPHAARLVAVAATIAWFALLCVDAYGGGLGAVGQVVGGVFGAPAIVMLALTLLFVAAGSWSAAAIGTEVSRRLLGVRPVEIPAETIRSE